MLLFTKMCHTAQICTWAGTIPVLPLIVHYKHEESVPVLPRCLENVQTFRKVAFLTLLPGCG